jgi:hypothetical protein
MAQELAAEIQKPKQQADAANLPRVAYLLSRSTRR